MPLCGAVSQALSSLGDPKEAVGTGSKGGHGWGADTETDFTVRQACTQAWWIRRGIPLVTRETKIKTNEIPPLTHFKGYNKKEKQ